MLFFVISFKKMHVTLECQTCRLGLFPMPGDRTLLPNCKFGTPDNRPVITKSKTFCKSPVTLLRAFFIMAFSIKNTHWLFHTQCICNNFRSSPLCFHTQDNSVHRLAIEKLFFLSLPIESFLVRYSSLI